MNTFNNFNELAIANALGFMNNMSPSGWRAAIKQDLPPLDKGYEFVVERRNDDYDYRIIGYPITDGTRDGTQAFYVVDAPILIDKAEAERIAEGLNMKYRSQAVRDANLGR